VPPPVLLGARKRLIVFGANNFRSLPTLSLPIAVPMDYAPRTERPVPAHAVDGVEPLIGCLETRVQGRVRPESGPDAVQVPGGMLPYCRCLPLSSASLFLASPFVTVRPSSSGYLVTTAYRTAQSLEIQRLRPMQFDEPSQKMTSVKQTQNLAFTSGRTVPFSLMRFSRAQRLSSRVVSSG
jgi:hypothetical protein